MEHKAVRMCVFSIAKWISLGVLMSLLSGDGDSSTSASPCSFSCPYWQYHVEAQRRREVQRDKDTTVSTWIMIMATAGLSCWFCVYPALYRAWGLFVEERTTLTGLVAGGRISPLVWPWGSGWHRMEGDNYYRAHALGKKWWCVGEWG